MKRLARLFAIFSVPLLVLLAAGEWVVRQYPNSYSYKHQWMESHAGSVQTLLLGASHTYYAIMPQLLGPGTFNLSNVSQLYEYDRFLLERYEARLGQLRQVVLVVDDSSPFDAPLEDLPEDWHRCIYYRLYMDYPKHSLCSRYGLELSSQQSFRRKLAPALRYQLTGQALLDCDSLGFGNTFATPERFDSVVMQRESFIAIERHRCKDWALVDKNREDLLQIARWCQQRGVRLVLVTTPMWRGFYSHIGQRQLDVMYELARECVDRYGAIYLDYMRDERFQGTDFHDGDHLSRQGAEKFTRLLKHDARL